jgi:ketosteroid isomerase-like protein
MSRRQKILEALTSWNRAWNRHDLEGVMRLFHEDVVFENWTGARIRGKQKLRQAWSAWFENHGDFRFIEEETFVDPEQQKVLFRWRLEWPSTLPKHSGASEIRRGVDVLHFREGRIVRKLTYSKTTVEVAGKRIPLVPSD